MKHCKMLSIAILLAMTAQVYAEDNDAEDGNKDSAKFEFNNATFQAPEMLVAGGEPMKAGYSYPSPAMFDVDNDGEIEMVLGEIMGTVSYCENENKDGGDPVWGPVQPVLNTEGKPLKLNNW